MNTLVEEKRIFQLTGPEESRLQAIREGLSRGDVKKIADRQNVSREWASKVIHGHGVSEPLLQAAEAFIMEKDKRE